MPGRGRERGEVVGPTPGQQHALEREQRQPALGLGPFDVVVGRAQLDEPNVVGRRASNHSSCFGSLPPMAKAASAVGARSRRVLLIVGGVLFGLALLVALASLAEHTMYSGSVLPGVRIDGTHVGGKKQADGHRRDRETRHATRFATYPRARRVQEPFAVDPSLIGFSVDPDATVARGERRGPRQEPVPDGRRHRAAPLPARSSCTSSCTTTLRAFEGLLDGWTNALRTGLVEGDLRVPGHDRRSRDAPRRPGTPACPGREEHAGPAARAEPAPTSRSRSATSTRRSTRPPSTPQPSKPARC